MALWNGRTGKMLATSALQADVEAASAGVQTEEELAGALAEQLRLSDKRREYLRSRRNVVNEAADRLSSLDELYKEVL